MILLQLLYLVTTIVAALPVVLGLVVGIKFRRREAAPLWLTLVVLGVASGWALLLIWVPGLPDSTSIALLSGMSVCGVVGIASLLRRINGVSFGSALVATGLAALLFLLWTDWRFRVVVRDRDGRPVEVRKGDITLHHPQETYLQNYRTAKGIELTPGTTYFGLIRWLEWKDHWTFSSYITDTNGHDVGDLKWEPARWSAWPKVVTAK